MRKNLRKTLLIAMLAVSVSGSVFANGKKDTFVPTTQESASERKAKKAAEEKQKEEQAAAEGEKKIQEAAATERKKNAELAKKASAAAQEELKNDPNYSTWKKSMWTKKDAETLGYRNYDDIPKQDDDEKKESALALALPDHKTTVENKKVLDAPLTGGIAKFYQGLDDFAGTVAFLCCLFAFLMIICCAFKLWMGTIEVKKAYVDMIYKCLMCFAVMAVYKPVTDSCIVLAADIGKSCCGGYAQIETTYLNAFRNLLTAVKMGSTKLKESLLANAFTTGTGTKYLTDESIKSLEQSGYSHDEALKWAEQNNIKIVHPVYTYDYVTARDSNNKLILKNTTTTKTYKTTFQAYVSEDGEIMNFSGIGADREGMVEENEKKAVKKAGYDEKKQQLYIKKLEALSQVLTGAGIKLTEDGDKTVDIANMSVDDVKNMHYSPWLRNSKKQDTYFISPNYILKTCVTLSDAVTYSLTLELQEDGTVKEVTFNPGGEWFISGIIKFVSSLIYKLGMMLCSIIIMAEYTITILEFFLLRAVGSLLIPLLFLDSTKSYSQNLLKLLFSYFFKILLVVICCFFSLSLYMDAITFITSSADPSVTMTLVTYLSTLCLGLMLSLNAGKLASSLISGQPAMGVGDIARIGHGMVHAGHAAEHMAHKYGSLAGKGVQGMARGGMGLAATLDTANNASKRTRSALEQARESGQFTGSDKDIRMAAAGSWMKAMGMQLGQKIGDSAHKTFTGIDRAHLDAQGRNNGFLKVGQEFQAEGGRMRKATYADVVAAGQQKIANVGNLDSLKSGSLGKHFVQTDKDRNGGSNGSTGGTEAPEENTSQIKLPQNEDRNGFGVK